MPPTHPARRPPPPQSRSLSLPTLAPPPAPRRTSSASAVVNIASPARLLALRRPPLTPGPPPAPFPNARPRTLAAVPKRKRVGAGAAKKGAGKGTAGGGVKATAVGRGNKRPEPDEGVDEVPMTAISVEQHRAATPAPLSPPSTAPQPTPSPAPSTPSTLDLVQEAMLTSIDTSLPPPVPASSSAPPPPTPPLSLPPPQQNTWRVFPRAGWSRQPSPTNEEPGRGGIAIPRMVMARPKEGDEEEECPSEDEVRRHTSDVGLSVIPWAAPTLLPRAPSPEDAAGVRTWSLLDTLFFPPRAANPLAMTATDGRKRAAGSGVFGFAGASRAPTTARPAVGLEAFDTMTLTSALRMAQVMRAALEAARRAGGG
ncbi:hypothetical protein BDK51DRAFT_32161 [Blyttiomyces helicus]|uniref:Uncharacterized protein n=1 Tax=Blyttiomyces helicus TaxID=388810 RepID=A0A4P9WDR3_9FUNG|nr:hypothetical protein BDK51DRAFT_32161 [Blyttiomyces helicus]|eukprot:RKO90704.1 hypothetical protein BDK51DRAFT_32161 [Blyttiomyces helicus]